VAAVGVLDGGDLPVGPGRLGVVPADVGGAAVGFAQRYAGAAAHGPIAAHWGAHGRAPAVQSGSLCCGESRVLGHGPV
jgi:hypothetical protein